MALKNLNKNDGFQPLNMSAEVTFEMLAQTLERCGVSVELRDLADDDINIHSGLCEIGGRKTLIIDERLGESGRVAVALEAVRSQNLDGIFVPPAIREALNDEF
jgi:hypothetical protein